MLLIFSIFILPVNNILFFILFLFNPQKVPNLDL